MSERFFPSPEETSVELEANPDLYEEMQKLEKERNPTFYKNYNKLKDFFKDLKELELGQKTKIKSDKLKELGELKEIVNNYKIIEEILITGTSKDLQKLTFFHDYKSLNILVNFCELDTLDLSGLRIIDEEHARILSNFSGKYLYLNGLESISDEAFTELIKFKGDILGLERIKYLSEYQYSILKDRKCRFIDLNV